MTDNLALWHAVEKTPVEHTKPITGKSYSGNSPNPHYLVQKATETFGPCGIGWGFSIEERVETGAMIDGGFFEKLHIAKVKVWYRWNGERGEVEHIGGTPLSGKRANGKIYTDEDAPKKSVTDALVKALSMLGFAGDIFMGRYDDSKYMQELREEAAEAKRDASKPKWPETPEVSSGLPKKTPRATYIGLAEGIIGQTDKSATDLIEWWRSEGENRRNAGLTQADVDALKDKLTARLNTNSEKDAA